MKSQTEYRITILEGPQPGQSIPLAKEVITVGRAEDNDIVLSMANVSRHHARLQFNGTQYVVEDLGAANGVHVNNERIARARPLSDGDQIRLGANTLVQYSVLAPPAQAPTVLDIDHQPTVTPPTAAVPAESIVPPAAFAPPAPSLYQPPPVVSEAPPPYQPALGGNAFYISSAAPQPLSLENATPGLVYIWRNVGPAWLYIDYGRYHMLSSYLEVQPYEVVEAVIYPHRVRPLYAQREIRPSEVHTVDIECQGSQNALYTAFITLGVLVALYILANIAWLTGLSSGIASRVATGFIYLLMANMLVVSWFMFMMPARLLWLGFGALTRISHSPFGAPIRGTIYRIQGLIFSQFAQGHIAGIMRSAGALVIYALTVGFFGALLITFFMLIFSVIVYFLVPSLLFLFGLVTSGGLLFIAHRVLREYNILGGK